VLSTPGFQHLAENLVGGTGEADCRQVVLIIEVEIQRPVELLRGGFELGVG